MVVVNDIRRGEVNFRLGGRWLMITIHENGRYEIWMSGEPTSLGHVHRTYEAFKKKIRFTNRDICESIEKKVISGVFEQLKKVV